MPLNGTQITTLRGQQKLAQAVMGTGPRVDITDVALGDGLGAPYEPVEGQTALRREKVRRPITRRHMSDDRTWRVVVEFGTDIPAFWMREIGFFDATGELIFLTAGAQITQGYTSAFDLIFDGYLNLTGIKNGLVIVEAPDDVLFDLAVQTGIALADLQLNQLRQADALRAQHGPF